MTVQYDRKASKDFEIILTFRMSHDFCFIYELRKERYQMWLFLNSLMKIDLRKGTFEKLLAFIEGVKELKVNKNDRNGGKIGNIFTDSPRVILRFRYKFR